MLPECVKDWQSAADLFAAAFGGANTSSHLMHVPYVALVDLDSERLYQVPRRAEWRYFVDDAFDWAEIRTDREFDGVILDPWTDQSEYVWFNLELFTRIARRNVIIGGPETGGVVPLGWRMVDVMRRSDYLGGIYWYTLERI